MLVWWILSALIVLIVCFIFAYRMIVSSYEFLPADKRYFLGFYKNPLSQKTGRVQRDKLKPLNRKVQPGEDNISYGLEFSKFQDRLKALEELNTLKPSFVKIASATEPEDGEDWKEMYYEENTIKEKLENDLDYTRQMLAEAEDKLKDAAEKDTGWVKLQSEHESRLHDLYSSQEHIELLKRQLEASADREKETEQLLLSEMTLREKHSLLQREHIQLRSEADDMRRRIAELNKKDAALQMRVARLNELESKLAICREEKIRLRN